MQLWVFRVRMPGRIGRGARGILCLHLTPLSQAQHPWFGGLRYGPTISRTVSTKLRVGRRLQCQQFLDDPCAWHTVPKSQDLYRLFLRNDTI